MTWNYSNVAVQTALSAGIDGVVTSLTVGSIAGFPVVYPYTLILDYLAANAEVVNVTAGVGTTLTVTRGQDGTAAVPHATNAVVAHGVVARDLAEPQAHIPIAVAHMAASTNVHGLAGAATVVGTTTAQTLSNKTLGNTNAVTLKDSLFTLQGVADVTKQAQFETASITTGTTRTFTLPDVDGTLVTQALAQPLSNKTFGITNLVTLRDDRFTLQDSLDITKQAEFQLNGLTTATTRTYTMPNASGTLVDLTTYPFDTAWATWVPVWTNLTVGNGTVSARYKQIGKTVHYRLKFTLGSTSALAAGGPTWTVPVTPHSSFVNDDMFGLGHAVDSGIQTYVLGVFYSGGGIARFSTSSTSPFTYGTGDWFESVFTYEAP